MPSSLDLARRPKVVLHDHLDGGVRPATVIELAREAGVAVPTRDVGELARWFTIRPGMPLGEAWARFYLVIAVLQSPEAIHRMAREAVEDLAADGVVYAELRFAPLNHLAGGLSGDEVVEAAVAGLAEGERASGCVARLIVCGIRENDPTESVAAARLAGRWRERGVVGFDLAGNEEAYSVGLHAEAFRIAAEAGLGITIHAGEMAGVESIEAALDCGARRLGHGWRIVDDCEVTGGRITGLGSVAGRVHEAGIPLETCVTSNSCLGLPVEEHPVRMLLDAGFGITVNPDDRAITTTTVLREHEVLARVHGFTEAEFAACHETAMRAAFCDQATKDRLLRDVIRPRWA
jgi:adenosine deaminase